MRSTWSVGVLVVGVLAANVLLAALEAHADDWPQWRGPNRDGVWRETGIVDKLPAQLTPVWSVPVASGYSGPTVAGGRVFVTDRLFEPQQQERVHCFDEKTGAKLWTHTYDCVYRGVGYEAGPRANVTVHDGRAYALGAMGHFFCFDAATGKPHWQKDLNADYHISDPDAKKTRMPIWGLASAPLVEGPLVILQIGGRNKACIVAFDRLTGEEKWKALDDRASYSAPIMIEQGGQRVLVCWTGDNIVGLAPASGEVYWSVSFKPTRMVINISTPVVDSGRMFVTAFYDGAAMLTLANDKPAATQLWRRLGPDEKNTDALHSIIATPYLSGDYVYGVDSYGELRCLDAKTGDRIWESDKPTPKARWSNIHMVRNGEKMWMFNERGELIIAQLSPQGYNEISRGKLIEPTTVQLNQRKGVCWSHPAFANKHVLIRNDERMVRASLAAE